VPCLVGPEHLFSLLAGEGGEKKKERVRRTTWSGSGRQPSRQDPPSHPEEGKKRKKGGGMGAQSGSAREYPAGRRPFPLWPAVENKEKKKRAVTGPS